MIEGNGRFMGQVDCALDEAMSVDESEIIERAAWVLYLQGMANAAAALGFPFEQGYASKAADILKDEVEFKISEVEL